MTAPTVVIANLRRSYGTAVVLDLPHLVLPQGTTAVLGPNGAGKTTLLRALATVAPLEPGCVLVDGADAADPGQRLSIRRRLGYAGQEETLPERMRVGEFCDYVGALKEITPARRRRQWTAWVLEQVGLVEHQRDRIGSLSGGMRRRLALAQSLLGEPELLILDEPLVSLDANHRSSLVRLIAASADSRTTIVATHHADELAAVCRHVIVLAGGEVVFAGPPLALATRATDRVWETDYPLDRSGVRALAPDRFRIVGERPDRGRAVDPTVHDGYLAVLAELHQPTTF